MQMFQQMSQNVVTDLYRYGCEQTTVRSQAKCTVGQRHERSSAVNRCSLCGQPTFGTDRCFSCVAGGATAAPQPRPTTATPAGAQRPVARGRVGAWLHNRSFSTRGFIEEMPQVQFDRRGIGAAGRILLFPLLLAAVVTNHTFITLMEYALVVVILMFMLRRSRRYGRWIPAIPWFMAVPMIRRGRPPRPRGESVLSFRLTHPNGQTACHLGGHEGGIVPGDEVEVAGFRVGGILHAARVRNLTTGASYTRTRMISTGTVLACDALLLGITVNQVSGWWG